MVNRGMSKGLQASGSPLSWLLFSCKIDSRDMPATLVGMVPENTGGERGQGVRVRV